MLAEPAGRRGFRWSELAEIRVEAADHSALIREHLVHQWDARSEVFESCIAEAQR